MLIQRQSNLAQALGLWRRLRRRPVAAALIFVFIAALIGGSLQIFWHLWHKMTD